MLTFLAGCACGVLAMLAALTLIMRSSDSEPQPDRCPHDDDWDYCPICRH